VEYVNKKSGGSILTSEYDEEGILLYKCLEKGCYSIFDLSHFKRIQYW
jgi:hypothetical protein